MEYGCTINVAFSSFSVLEFSVNRLISDLSATFSADKASTFRASSSVSAWKEEALASYLH